MKGTSHATLCVCVHVWVRVCVCVCGTDVSVGQGDGLHQVHTLCVDLDEGEDVSSLDGVAQRVKLGRPVWTLPPGEALLCVLS